MECIPGWEFGHPFESDQYKPPITPWNPPTQEEVDEEAREKR